MNNAKTLSMLYNIIMGKMFVTVGVPVYNEDKNIRELILSILNQKLNNIIISEIIIVSSGSTDKTNTIINSLKSKHLHIKLVKQNKRVGKAAAVNIILANAKEDIILLTSADLFIPPTTVSKLISPLKDKKIGITGSRPIPLNDAQKFFGFAAHLLWNLHHEISLKNPKMGECIAFRKIFKQIPIVSSVDEANIESLIKGQGYKSVYVPDAIIYNKGAETLGDFVSRRRHIYAGHLETKYNYGYSVSTLNNLNTIHAFFRVFPVSGKALFWTPPVIFLEMYSRLLGIMDYKMKRHHTVWKITESTKSLPQVKYNLPG